MCFPIKDYALIGDCHSAALVSRHGSIDWLCLPRFDSPSVFGALLDAQRGGRFTVRPTGSFQVERHYVGNTAVLETRFFTSSGVLRVLDAMPVVDEKEGHASLRPSHEVLRNHVHSKAMCWVAVERIVRMHDAGMLRAPIEHSRKGRDTIRAAIETRGYSQVLRSYTTVFDGDNIDASLLLLARYRYVDANGRRMVVAYERIQERLIRGSLVLRFLSNRDGLPAGEGAFGIASFWAAEALARQGKYKEADSLFKHLLNLLNHVGLFAEEIDVETKAALGNFPQAFTHVGLIDAALMIAEEAGHPGLRDAEKRPHTTRARV